MCVGRLGVGAFGMVTLEVHKRSGRTYALKAVSKGYLEQLKMQRSVQNEKQILGMVQSRFIVRLVTTYIDRDHFFFLLEAALGGELFSTYERLDLYGSETHAKFYAGCVVEALIHLHERHIIYRDLKPENLLLDESGYCKLTDMGLAKVTDLPTYTVVGTPDYMAPEVIDGCGHNHAVDWWMLGVLIFELLVGEAPFHSSTPQLMYELVKLGIDEVKFPPVCPCLAIDVVRALCRPNPVVRLSGSELRSDPWFHGFDWVSLRKFQLEPPYIPQVQGPCDTTNFRNCEEVERPFVDCSPDGDNWDDGFADST